jgi:thioredoxin 1
MAAANIVNLTTENFEAEVIHSPKPILIDFWAEWCGPCKALVPILDELAAEYDGRVRIGKVNVDEHQELAAKYGVQSIPTMLFFKNGEITEQVVGLRGKRELKLKLDALAAP